MKEQNQNLKLVLAVRNSGNKDARLVFEVTPGTFVVVKFFGDAHTVTSVKVWTGSSVKKTSSYWNTTVEFEPDDHTVAAAIDAIGNAASALTRGFGG